MNFEVQMKIFNKKPKTPWTKPFSETVAKRVSKIPTGELTLWVDNALYEVGRCVSSYERSRDIKILEEALSGAEAVHAVVNELHTRMTKTKL